MAATTLDPNAKSSGITLSGSNLIATSTAAGNAATTRNLTGKHYFEAVITTLAGTPAVGLVNQLFVFSTALLGADTNSLAYKSSGAVVVNGVTLATIATFIVTNRIDCAVDPANRFIWFRVAGGNWNNNVANDPATGVGGIDISSMNLGTLRGAVGASATGTVWTMTFSTPFVGTPPTGFVSLDTIQTTSGRSSVSYGGPLAVAPDFSLVAGRATLGKNQMVRSFSPAGASTVVSGTTKESGVAVSGKKVYMYDRTTGELIGCATSDGSGNWSIPAVGRPAVRIDGSDPPYNSVTYDNVIPL